MKDAKLIITMVVEGNITYYIVGIKTIIIEEEAAYTIKSYFSINIIITTITKDTSKIMAITVTIAAAVIIVIEVVVDYILITLLLLYLNITNLKD
jgi:hypothetical protein